MSDQNDPASPKPQNSEDLCVITFTRSFLQSDKDTIKDIMVLYNLCSSLRDIRVDTPLLVLLGIHALAVTLSVWLRYKEPIFTLLVFAVYGPVLTVTILINEFAREVTKKQVARNRKDSLLYDKVYNELCIVISGPLTHIPQCIFWFGIYVKINQGDISHFDLVIDIDSLNAGGAIAFVSVLAFQAAVMNVVMLKLNLAIPIYPFSGGKALVALLVLGGASFYTAGIVTSCAGILMGMLLFWLGFFAFLIDYDIMAVCLGALACFSLFSGIRLLRMTLSGNVKDHVLFHRQCYMEDESSDDKVEHVVQIV